MDKVKAAGALFTPETDKSKVEVDGPRQTWTAEQILEDAERAAENREHRADVAAIRASLEDSAPVNNISPRKVLGMNGTGTMRLAGSIPIEIWNADQCLRPGLTVAERARDLLKRFPVYRIGAV